MRLPARLASALLLALDHKSMPLERVRGPRRRRRLRAGTRSESCGLRWRGRGRGEGRIGHQQKVHRRWRKAGLHGVSRAELGRPRGDEHELLPDELLWLAEPRVHRRLTRAAVRARRARTLRAFRGGVSGRADGPVHGRNGSGSSESVVTEMGAWKSTLGWSRTVRRRPAPHSRHAAG